MLDSYGIIDIKLWLMVEVLAVSVIRPNTDSAIAALYILLDSSEDAFC